MLFHSVHFLIFFPVVTLLFFLIPKRLRAFWLLVASYYFYMSWNARYALLIGLSTVVTYACALVLARTDKKSVRILSLVCNLALNLGILFFFKYFSFGFDVLLPVGISFYTFQALGYTIDVYRGDTQAEKNFIRYALFVSFFPQLVAGPIERSKRLLTQIDAIEEIRVWEYGRITRGLTLMLWGLFIKLVIADRIAVIADTVFDAPFGYGSFELLCGAFAFAIQIYCDFNAYSVIAKGAALVLGFTLMDNFDTPYLAQNVTEFWNRWHISLSTWFRDYVYIPLGGNRKGQLRKYVNLMITFTLSGIWHGAGLSFVAWGLCHGAMRVMQEMLQAPLKKLGDLLHVKRETFSMKLGKILVTDFCVMLAWVFFRAGSVSRALFCLEKIFTRPNPWALFGGNLYTLGLDRFECNVLIVALVVLLAHDLYLYLKKEDLPAFLGRQNLWFRWGVIIALIVCVLVYGIYGVEFDSSQFIYFQF
ncbi:MAG: MBOAT family protein [Lachnospiraceae bacterium]|nr:MBOAT family protein [Lachnospiraceae bacterium]